ncbi:hypothetical protein TNCV_4177651 [Trichonephila clavipes]|nr:hypothetical protein TNCV_4177651 [Trichonephila clavipes]
MPRDETSVVICNSAFGSGSAKNVGFDMAFLISSNASCVSDVHSNGVSFLKRFVNLEREMKWGRRMDMVDAWSPAEVLILKVWDLLSLCLSVSKSGQMNSLAACVKLTYSFSMVDRLTDFCLKVRHEIGVSSIKVMNPPIDTRSSLFVAKSESE